MDLDTALTGKSVNSCAGTDILRADHEEIRRLTLKKKLTGATEEVQGRA